MSVDPLTPAEARQLRAALEALPQLAPPDLWHRLRASRAPAPARSARLLVGTMGVAAALALLAFGALLRHFDDGLIPYARAAEIADLQARSAALERRLATLPERRLVRGGSGLTTVALQDRILVVDEQLSEGTDQRADARARALWRERCALLHALLEVRAASATDISF